MSAVERVLRPMAAAAIALAATTCSTLEKKPAPKQCELSSDCAETEVCQNGRCEDASKDPPLSHLAFDIEERTGQEIFRAQIWGCDREVVDAMEGREIRISRSEVAQRFELQVHARDGVDVDNLVEGDLLPADLVLTQGGRFGRLPISRDGIEHPPAGGEMQAVASAIVPWPRYHLFDARLPAAHVVWETRPEPVMIGETMEPRGSVLRMFRPPETLGPRECTTDAECCNGEGCDPSPNFCNPETGHCELGCRNDLDCCQGSGCEPTPPNFCVAGVQECSLIGNPSFLYAYRYDTRCDREIEGKVLVVDLRSGQVTDAGAASASVRLRHADLPGAPPLGVPDSSLGNLSSLEPECDPGEVGGCGHPDLVCDPDTRQCILALAGRDAGSATTSEPNAIEIGAPFQAPVYTYCEGTADVPFDRGFSIQVTPDVKTALPSVNLVAETNVTPTGGNLTFDQRLCVPDWGAPTVLALELSGVPRQLVEGTSAFGCCDVGCLPATADALDPAAMNAETCNGTTSAGVQPNVTLVAEFRLDDDTRAVWDAADCLPPVDGVIGRLSRKADCSLGDTCAVAGLAAGDADGPRTYAVRVESPVGSVLGSTDTVVHIPTTPATIERIELPARVIVRGQVDVGESVCARRDDPEDDCASRGAVVLAERLAVNGETNADVPGPYLHQVSTFFDPIAGRDGAFVLPLDPGVWVVTALPTGNNDGGPAGFTVLDLREAVAPAPLRLVLEEGNLVTLNLRTFDRRSTVAPLDLGSWEGLGLPDGTPVDLNATITCLAPAGDPVQGCRIRQLVPPGSSLTLTQVGLAFFTARQPASAASATCGAGG